MKVMTNRTSKENRKLLRQYIRRLNKYEGMNQTNKAKSFFTVLHNFLSIEDKCYDQCLTLDKQLNVHLNLLRSPKFYSNLLSYFNKYYDPNHRIRISLETFDVIDDARVFLDNVDEDIYSRIILDSEFEELWDKSFNTVK